MLMRSVIPEHTGAFACIGLNVVDCQESSRKGSFDAEQHLSEIDIEDAHVQEHPSLVRSKSWRKHQARSSSAAAYQQPIRHRDCENLMASLRRLVSRFA